jgi:hypothetical protein
LPSQNFRVKNGLEVGTGVTISAGIITATTFSGAVNASTITATSYGNINSTTLNVTGVSTFGSSVYLGDGDVAYFGDGQDLLIFHNSTDSIIRDNGTGDLYIEGGNRIKMTSPTGIETYAVFNQDGAAELWYDNSKKLETAGAGVTVTGTTFTNQLNVSGISTLGNTVVGGATTQLIVNGNARITGILTIGTSSVTFNGSNDSVTIGTGVTIFGNTGIVSATEFRGNGASLTGVQPFPSGTLMLFQQTAAPTGWTKQTTHNDKTLRVVSGSASSGGTTAFSSVMTSRTPSGSVSVSGSNSGGSIANTTVTGSVSGSNSGGGVSNTTLSTAEMPSHSHYMSEAYTGTNGPFAITGGDAGGGGGPYNTGSTGGGGAHGHGFTNPSWSGSVSMNAHSHTFTNPSWSGSASFSGASMDFNVQYVDLIIASKD